MSTALVTGGAKRIGKAIALSLADRGINIALHYHTSKKDAEKLQKEIESKSVVCGLFQCDLQDMHQVENLIPKVFEKFPDTNLLINSASIFKRAGLMDSDTDLFDQHMNIHLKAPFFLTQHFARYCSRGHVINLLDTKISRVLIQYFAYTLSKKALADFTRMAAKELGPNIRVNGVCPGLILPSADMSQEEFIHQGDHLPLKQTGNPEHIVSAIQFLLDNPFVTGEILLVDGGEHLKS